MKHSYTDRNRIRDGNSGIPRVGTWCLEERIGNLIPNQDLKTVNLFRSSLSPMGSSQLTQDLLPRLKDQRPIRVVSRVHKLAVVKPVGRNLNITCWGNVLQLLFQPYLSLGGGLLVGKPRLPS